MSEENLIWLDLEMTGLDPTVDRIIEIATIVTDGELNVLAEGPVIAVHQPDHVLANMNDWCQDVHGNSGLTARVQQSNIDVTAAERQTLAFVRQYAAANTAPLCGNSIWQDRRFLGKYMPRLEQFFHYRMVDVSTFKELARRWAPEVYAGLQKQSTHKALDDIRDSIAELKYYRQQVWRNPPTDAEAH